MIVTITMNPAVDKSTTMEKLVPEKKIRCGPLVTEAGGGGINISKAIRKLGGESLAIFPSGGLNGKLLEQFLESQKIAFKTIELKAETRENFTATEKGSNTQYRFVMPGAEVSDKEMNQCFAILRELKPRPTIIVASGSLPPGLPENFFAELARVAKELGAKYIVDSSGKPLLLAAQQGVYLLKPNMTELNALAGTEHLELNEVDEAAKKVISNGQCEVLVVSMGPNGALLVTKEGYEHIPSPTVKKKTTVGAGDSMVAGMALMLSQGKPLKEVVQFGVACGTAATLGTGTSLFELPEVHRIFDWIRNHSERYKLNLE